MLQKKHYQVLLFILCFYVVAQIFQQYVTRLGPMSSLNGLEETIIAGQHALNYTRMVLILVSMFLMIPGAILLGLHYFRCSPVFSIVATTFFLFFCLFETSYRSVQLFQVMSVWGKEFAEVTPDVRAILLPKFQNFYDTVSALYFPLLASFFLGSLALMFASLKESDSKAVTWAMAIHCVQQMSRLSSYTPLKALNVFTGIWYFVIVAIVFGLLIYWTINRIKSAVA